MKLWLGSVLRYLADMIDPLEVRIGERGVGGCDDDVLWNELHRRWGSRRADEVA